MKFIRDESGQALVLTAMSVTLLLGFLALALDVGLLFRIRRNMQIAADAAAIAGAQNYIYYGSQSSATLAAYSAAKSNGVDSNATGNVVTVSIPPIDGPNAGAAGSVEVQLSTPNPTLFMSLFGMNTVAVAARAVAGTPTPSSACVWIGDPTASDAFHLQGSATVDATGNCGIYINSGAADAVKMTGAASTVTAAFLNDYGGYTGQNSLPTQITTGAPAESNPFGSVTGPTTASCGGSNTISATTVTQSQVNGATPANGVVCFSGNNPTISAGVTLPGSSSGIVYLFENGVTIPSGAPVTFGSATYNSSTGQFSPALGAVMDLYGGTLNQASNSMLNIYAPTSGANNGIAILQPVGNTGPLQVQWGSINQTFDGAIYAPGAEVLLQDNGGGVTATAIIADTMYVKSSSITIPSYSNANQATTPLRVVTLVE